MGDERWTVYRFKHADGEWLGWNVVEGEVGAGDLGVDETIIVVPEARVAELERALRELYDATWRWAHVNGIATARKRARAALAPLPEEDKQR